MAFMSYQGPSSELPPSAQCDKDVLSGGRRDRWRLDRSATIALMSVIIIAGFAAACVYHFDLGLAGGQTLPDVQLHNPDGSLGASYPFLYISRQYPESTFLFIPWEKFGDFYRPYDSLKNPEKYKDQPYVFNHFPFAYLYLGLFTLMPAKWGLILWMAPSLLAFLAVCFYYLKGNGHFDTWRNVAVFSLLSYPLIFAVDRANNELLVFLLVQAFLLAFAKGRYTLSTLPLAVAVAFKPFPAIFLGLFILQKRYKEVVWVVLMSAALTLLAIPAISHWFAYDPTVLRKSWPQYTQLYIVGDGGLAFGNSLWGALKLFLMHLKEKTCSREILYAQVISGAMKPYQYTVGVLFLGFCFYLWRWERKLWKQVAVLAFAMDIFPFVSGDYKLLYVYAPLFLFVNRRSFERLDVVYAVLFALLLIPKNYYRFNWDVNLGVVLNPAIMLTFSCLIIGTGLWARRQHWRMPWIAATQSLAAAAKAR
jgi:hypothetical protein